MKIESFGGKNMNTSNKSLSERVRSILPIIWIVDILSWGIVSCKDENSAWNQAIEQTPSISTSSNAVSLLKEIFPAGRQITEVNPIMEKLQKKWIIKAIKNKESIPDTFINMEEEHSDKFAFIDVSNPRAHPMFAQVLLDISNEFNERLKYLWYKWDYVKITITSLTRPTNTLLSNASKNSSYKFGVAADLRIVNDRFDTGNEEGADEDLFMFTLVEVLDEFHAEWKIIVMCEKNPPHLHVNIGDGTPREKSPILIKMRGESLAKFLKNNPDYKPPKEK